MLRSFKRIPRECRQDKKTTTTGTCCMYCSMNTESSALGDYFHSLTVEHTSSSNENQIRCIHIGARLVFGVGPDCYDPTVMLFLFLGLV